MTTVTAKDRAETRPPPLWLETLIAAISALAGLAVAHLVAAFVEPRASPVIVLGDAAIELAPTPVKTWAVATFGTADKPLLAAGVSVGVVVTAALCALAARRRPGIVLSVLLVLTALLLAWVGARPGAGSLDVLVPLAGLLVAYLLYASAGRWARTGAPPGVAAPRDSADGEYADQRGTPIGRRPLLTALGATAVLAGIAAYAGQALVTAAETVRSVVLPRPAKPLPPLPTSTPVPADDPLNGVSPLAVPPDDLYRIDTALVVPRVDPDSWSLTVDGRVDNPFTITFAELLAMPLIERDVTLVCVSNQVGGPYAGGGRWLGVPTREILQRAKVRAGVDQILSTDVQGMTISTPLQALLDDRDAILAVGYNGRPLPAEHGFPVRLVTPRLYGFVGSTKWVTRLTATTYAAEQAFWTKRGWVIDAPILATARIDTPRAGASVPADTPGYVGGVAWGAAGVEEVQVRIDDGPWTPARWGPDGGVDLWRQWYLPWVPTPGGHRLSARTVDRAGRVQPQDEHDPFPGAASGWHTVTVST